MPLRQRPDEQRPSPLRKLGSLINEQAARRDRRGPVSDRRRDGQPVRRLGWHERTVVVTARTHERPSVVGGDPQSIELIAAARSVIGEPEHAFGVARDSLNVAHASRDEPRLGTLVNVHELAPIRRRVLRARLPIIEVRDAHDEIARTEDEQTAGIERGRKRAACSCTIDATCVAQRISRHRRSPHLQRVCVLLFANEREVDAERAREIRRRRDIEQVRDAGDAPKGCTEPVLANAPDAAGPLRDERTLRSRQKRDAPRIDESVRDGRNAQLKAWAR